MPGLVIEPNLASARPSRTATGPQYNDAPSATMSVVKAEDDYEDDEAVYRPRPQLQAPVVLFRPISELMSK
jgi:hypothetical protein